MVNEWLLIVSENIKLLLSWAIIITCDIHDHFLLEISKLYIFIITAYAVVDSKNYIFVQTANHRVD